MQPYGAVTQEGWELLPVALFQKLASGILPEK